MDCLLTIVEFIFIGGAYTIKPSELDISFAIQEKYERENEKNKILIKFNSKCPSSKIYYCDLIYVNFGGTELCQFYYLIYMGKKNTIIFDLDETSKPSFEIFFYTTDSKLNPSKLKYKDKEYNQLENYGNKYRSRVFFANVDPSKLEYINSEIANKNDLILEDKTYQAIFRLINHSEFEASLSDMKNYYTEFFDIKFEKLNNEQLGELGTFFEQFMEKFWIFFDMDINDLTFLTKRQEVYTELKKLSDDIVDNNYYYLLRDPKKNVYDKYKDNDVILTLFYHDFFLNEFLQLYKIGCAFDLEKFKSIKETAIKNHSFTDKIFDKLIDDDNLNLEQKVKILKTTTIFFQNSLWENRKIFGVNYINLKKISNENPYYKSLQLLEQIISELAEDSRLFEAFLYFDSDVIQNIMIKNTQTNYSYKDSFGKIFDVEQPKFITEYGISLMTLGQIKGHLLDLLPSVIIQIDSDNKIRALFENKTNMMVINEFILFSKKNEEDFNTESDSYIIPITIEILHEILGHGKLRYGGEKEEDNYSPLAVRDSKNNFKIQKIIKKVKLFDNTEKEINRGETGRVLEHYISENPDVIQSLKRRNLLKEIMNVTYWTGKNFDLLHKALNYENKNTHSNLDNILGDYDGDDECYECIFN